MKFFLPSTRRVRLLVLLAALLLGVGMGAAYYVYDDFFRPNVNVSDEAVYLEIRTGSTRDDVLQTLSQRGLVKDMSSLIRAADKLGYSRKIYAGRYKILPNMSNRKFIHLLASGTQTPVNISFGSVRTVERLAGIIASQLEPDSARLLQALRDEATAAHYGFTTATFTCMFVPNTYQLYWNASADDFMQRMHKEWNKFWQANDRDTKLERLRMSRIEATILASIVSEETSKVDEMPAIAGVYVNRLRGRMPLQADPTVRFAVGNFFLRRILTSHTKIRSPYNTYLHRGLPPGPICVPPPAAIDAVLSYAEHDYLFFCANADFSGYHVFAKTFAQHTGNARAYQRALNKKRVY